MPGFGIEEGNLVFLGLTSAKPGACDSAALLPCELQIISPVRLSMGSFLHRDFRKHRQLHLWRFNMLQYLKLISPDLASSSRVAGQLNALTQSAGQHRGRSKFGGLFIFRLASAHLQEHEQILVMLQRAE
eukprot:s23_g65.t1